MASAPLNWLLKIGSAALKTTEQTLTGAVNELKDLISSSQSQADSQFSAVAADMSKKVNKTDVLNLEEIEATTNLTDKVAAAEAVKEVNDSLGGYKLTTVDGKIGYYLESVGADSAVPFSSGVINLGDGTTFDLSDYANYQNFTVDNFIVVPKEVSYGVSQNTQPAFAASVANYVYTYYIPPTISYDATTGTLTITRAISKATAQRTGDAMITSSIILSHTVYLVG